MVAFQIRVETKHGIVRDQFFLDDAMCGNQINQDPSDRDAQTSTSVNSSETALVHQVLIFEPMMTQSPLHNGTSFM